MLTVTAAASVTALTTLAAVKAEMRITDTSQDAYLTSRIDDASAMIADHCNRVFARETVTEVFRPRRMRHEPLMLARTPVIAINAVLEDGDIIAGGSNTIVVWSANGGVVTLAGGGALPTDPPATPGSLWDNGGMVCITDGSAPAPAVAVYEVDTSAGFVWRLDADGDDRVPWFAERVSISYDAGWVLPGLTGRNLPAAVERACVLTVAAWASARGRDPLLRSEAVEGVGSSSWIATDNTGALPPQAVDALARYISYTW
jgi:hypothetical protein